MENATYFYLVLALSILSITLIIAYTLLRRKNKILSKNWEAVCIVLDYLELGNWETREKGFWHRYDGFFVSFKDKERHNIMYNGEECSRPAGNIKWYYDRLNEKLSHLKYDAVTKVEIQRGFSCAAEEKIAMLITPIMSIENPHLPDIRKVMSEKFEYRINRTEIDNLFDVIDLYTTYAPKSEDSMFIKKLNTTIPAIFENLETYYGISGWKTDVVLSANINYLERFKKTIESIPYLSDEVRDTLLKKVEVAIKSRRE